MDSLRHNSWIYDGVPARPMTKVVTGLAAIPAISRCLCSDVALRSVSAGEKSHKIKARVARKG